MEYPHDISKDEGELMAAEPMAVESSSKRPDAVVRIFWSSPADDSDQSEKTIQKVLVVGRPVPPFQHREGNHMTAWSVLVDRVRRELIGLTLEKAANKVALLIAKYYDEDTTEDELPYTRYREYTEAYLRALRAVKLARKAYKEAKNGKASEQLLYTKEARLHLGTAVGAYLTARNLEPLSAVWIGPAQSVAGSESSALRTLRTYEETQDSQTSARKLQKSIWDLLDTKAIAFALDSDTYFSFPGFDYANKQTSARKIINRHLEEISYAYRLAYKASGLYIDATALINSLPGELGKALTSAFTTKDEIPPPVAATAAPEGWATQGGGVLVAFSVTRANEPRITNVNIDGVAPTLLGGQYHHVTARTVVERAVKRCIEGKTLQEAGDKLFALIENLKELPTLPKQKKLDEKIDPKGVFAQARRYLGSLLKMVGEDHQLKYDPDVIADLGAGYVALRNALPLATVPYGAPASGQGEGRWAVLLDHMEDRPGTLDAQQAIKAMWYLLDLQTLGHIHRGAVETPGAPASGVERICYVLKVHTETLKFAWPTCFNRIRLMTKKSVRWALNHTDIAPNDIDQICNVLEIPSGRNQQMPEPKSSRRGDSDFNPGRGPQFSTTTATSMELRGRNTSISEKQEEEGWSQEDSEFDQYSEHELPEAELLDEGYDTDDPQDVDPDQPPDELFDPRLSQQLPYPDLSPQTFGSGPSSSKRPGPEDSDDSDGEDRRGGKRSRKDADDEPFSR